MAAATSTSFNQLDLSSQPKSKREMVTCKKIMAQVIACATELAVVLFSLQTAFLLCWNLLIVFQKVVTENPEQIFSIKNDILGDDFMVLLSTVLFLSEGVVGLATAHQLHRWNKNNLRIKYKKSHKKAVTPQPPAYPYLDVPEEAKPLLLFPADVQPPSFPPPEFLVAIPSIHTMPLEPAEQPVKKDKKVPFCLSASNVLQGVRVSELAWMVIWISSIIVTATAVQVIPVTLGASAIFAFLVNLLVGETNIGKRKNKKNKDSQELVEQPQLVERWTWRSDPVTECVIWMQALLNFCKFMHHSVLVGIVFLTVPLDNVLFVITAFAIGVSFVVFRYGGKKITVNIDRQYMFYIFREKCKQYYQATAKRKYK